MDRVEVDATVFTSDAYEGLLRELGIEVCHTEKGKPWQNLIEAQFKVELRLADAAFEQATTLEEMQERHATFIELFNTTPHWAHRARDDELRTPVEVLRWVRGHEVDHGTLQQALRHLQMERVITLRGYISVQGFYLYAERGLSRQRVSVWLYEGRLHVAYRETVLAQYAYRYDHKARRLCTVDTPCLFQTTYASPQLEFWELDDTQWRKFGHRPYERRPVLPESSVRQLALSGIGSRKP